MEPPQARCSGLTAESQILLNRRDEGEGRSFVDFVLIVSVTNPCSDPLEVRYGSFARYQTNFAAAAQGGAQPPGCAGQQWSFAGVVPPNQRTPFTLLVERCAVSTARLEPPRVVVESGRVSTPRGEIPIPSVTKVLP